MRGKVRDTMVLYAHAWPLPLTVEPLVVGASFFSSETRALRTPKMSCIRDVAVSKMGCTRSWTVSRILVAFSGRGSGEVRMPERSLIVEERFAETSWKADWRVPGSAAVDACTVGETRLVSGRARGTHLNLVQLREHGVAERVNPSLRRAVAGGRELAEGLCGCLRALEDGALCLDLVDLLGRGGQELVAELPGEVVGALVLELGLGRLRDLICGAARLQLLHGNGEVIDNGSEPLKEGSSAFT